MKAIKCDRCGKYFDEDNRYKADVFYVCQCDRYSKLHHKDLCDDCLKSLDYWYNLNTPHATNIIVYEPDNFIPFIPSDVDFVYLVNSETKDKIKFVKEEATKYCHNCKHIKHADNPEDRCKYALTDCPINKEHWEETND